MKNRKGFTMVELLAVIVILGVLGTIGVVVTNRYLSQSRAKSYKVMSQTIYEAAMNCMVQGKCATPTSKDETITTDKLQQYGYLKKLENPISSRKECSGLVAVSVQGESTTEYKNYIYQVQLKCDGVANATLTWPDTKKADESTVLKKIMETAN